MDTTQLLNLTTPNTQQQPLQPGYLSTSQPAPTSPNSIAYVIVDAHTTDYNYACLFNMDHGVALPQQGAECLVGFDFENNPYLVWWAGEYAVRDAGGDASGTLADLQVNTVLGGETPATTAAPVVTAVTGFQNGWSAYPSPYAPYYWVDQFGVCWFQGLTQRASQDYIANQVMFTVPLTSLAYTIITAETDGGSSSGNAQVRITPEATNLTAISLGERGGPANPVGWLSLDAIHFRTR